MQQEQSGKSSVRTVQETTERFAQMYPEEHGDYVPPKDLYQLFDNSKREVIISAVVGLLAAIPGIAPYVAIANIAQLFYQDGLDASKSSLWFWVITAIVGLVLHHIMYVFSLGIAHKAEADLRGELRYKLVRHIGRLPMGWINSTNSGTIRMAVTDDTARIHTLIAHFAGDLSHGIGLVVAGIGYLLWVDWKLALTLLAIFFGIALLVGRTMFKPDDESMGHFYIAEKAMSEATIEMVDGIHEVKNFGITDQVFHKFDVARKNFSDFSYEWTMTMARPMAAIMALFQSASTLGLILLVSFIFGYMGWSEPLTIIPFAFVFVGIPGGLAALVVITRTLYEARMGAEKTLQIMQTPRMPIVANPQDPDVSDWVKQAHNDDKEDRVATVKLTDVAFGYDSDHIILSDINLSLTPNTITALIGPSGGGKTTIARLIARFWDVTSGSITVFGEDITNVSQQWLMRNISIVFQDTYLAPLSIGENIALGNPDASQEQIEQAAKDANIHDRIVRMPYGYDTQVGDIGGIMSGGERQRLTIARAFLADSPILILDEATAQADPRSEGMIRQSLERLSKGKTVIMIAHRLTTIKDADQIVVVANGTISERGTHDQLVAQDGMYVQLLKAQGLYE